MQLKRTLSVVTCSILAASIVTADDYVRLQYIYYDEDSGRTSVSTPAMEINKDFGVDYTLNVSLVYDSLSGASPTFVDASSGATATVSDGAVYKNDIRFADVDYADKRKSVGVAFTTRFASRDALTVGANFSNEYDYRSYEASAEYLHYLDGSKNQSVSLGASYQKNDVSVYCSLGTDICDTSSGASEKIMDLDVISLEVGFTQTIDTTSQIKASLFYIAEDGYLSNPYMRVVRDYDSNPKITPEKKPNSRKSYGLFLQYAKALNDRLAFVSSYRFYRDDWDIMSHTVNGEFYYEQSSALTLGAGLRYYRQNEAEFYNGRRDYFTTEIYASSDRRMSGYNALNYTVSIDYRLNDKISLNASMSYYDQLDYFDAVYYGMGLKYRF